jgi:hypothetical protein
MINQSHPYASWFLLVSTSFFLCIYALPLFFAPLWWARIFLWKVPEETDLTVYFGRCTGSLAIAMTVAMFEAVPDPQGHRAIFSLIGWTSVLLTLLHVWGAIRRVQPWTETAEILLYGGMAVLSIGFHSSLA